MLSDDERDTISRMDDETFRRQMAIEDIRQMRSMNAVAQVEGQFFRDFSEILGDRDFGLLEGFPGLDDVRAKAKQAVEAIDQFRATMAKFGEVSESKIDHTGLVTIPDQAAYDAIDRSREFWRLHDERTGE